MVSKTSNKKRIYDQHAAREAKRYDNPITSRECLLTIIEKHKKPLDFDTLLRMTGHKNPTEKLALRKRLQAMVRDGQLLRNRKKDYILPKKNDFIQGYVLAHRDGFGFLSQKNGEKDFFIPYHEMRKVLDGDLVLARITDYDKRGRQQISIVEILAHNTTVIVGELYKEDNVYFVQADNPKISTQFLIPEGKRNRAKPGEIVAAKILTYPSRQQLPTAAVTEILGSAHAAGLEVDIAIRTYNLPYKWPKKVQEAAKKFKKTVDTAEKKCRLDLRQLDFVTIDGEDAKDFDDAVYCEKKARGNYRLFVAIADVSHYVLPDTALDQEAQLRGNSVYFPERVIPMLPEVLSNELCSLKPKVDRLALVCEISLDPEFNVRAYRFHNAVIRSKARLTYTSVQEVLGQTQSIKTKKLSVNILKNLHLLYELYLGLQAKRSLRGAIEFEIPAVKILYNKEKKIDKILPSFRNNAHKLIEECMLLANVCAADLLLKKKMPGVYRNHPPPTEEKFTDLVAFLKELGLNVFLKKKPHPADYAKVLQGIVARPDSIMIQTVLLRSLGQALYQSQNTGHFGLAYDAYTHFTSPIRRYPDLLVHRALKHILTKKTAKTFMYDKEQMQNHAAHCSMTERRADEATRDAIEWLKCEYAMDRIGEIHEGIISGVTHFGIFVTLNDLYIEGLVHITELKHDFYHFDPVRHQLIGKKGKNDYQLGKKIRVNIAKVNLHTKKIDFILA